ncbi:hypothetical protein INT44_006686 [Umbelopsis vinacea]|uniref:Uncharacterized protein n=1 Tax=Umbelopsis vinacea TaxID=44442 RepID=A0A8H7PDH0_9FUNG|nr:hypothetical protein INT44_006686 [Umbelopsis vinacea]
MLLMMKNSQYVPIVNESEELLPEELVEEDEESSNHVTIEKRDMFTKEYERMREEQKWILSTGKCVEDELYKFAMQCEYEHPSLSFIIDPSDSTYKLQGVFTEVELREIKGYNAIVMDTLPDDVVDFLRSFDCQSSQELRKACLENLKWYYPFDREKHFNHDWIRRTIDML